MTRDDREHEPIPAPILAAWRAAEADPEHQDRIAATIPEETRLVLAELVRTHFDAALRRLRERKGQPEE